MPNMSELLHESGDDKVFGSPIAADLGLFGQWVKNSYISKFIGPLEDYPLI